MVDARVNVSVRFRPRPHDELLVSLTEETAYSHSMQNRVPNTESLSSRPLPIPLSSPVTTRDCGGSREHDTCWVQTSTV
jgi:hypothetical protein